MTGSGKLALTVVGTIFLMSALCVRGQQSSQAAADAPSERIAGPILAAPNTLADMPPNPPKVTCEEGKLTISATNSTLGAVLSAIRSCTGAEIDVPERAKGERFFGELGPGPVRTVLADFLSSTDFNYVIKASPSDPQRVQIVLLNLRNSDSATEVATEVASSGSGNMSTNRRAWLEARRNYEQSVSPPDEESTQPADAASSVTQTAETPPAPTISPSVEVEPVNSAPAAVAVSPTPENIVSSESAGSSSASSQGKSTQELISDMQRLFEKRKQMVEQQAATVR